MKNQTIKQLIEKLRAKGLNNLEILEKLDEAKGELDLISGPELLAKAREINPKYTKYAIYKQIERNMKDHARKINGIWYIERQTAEEWLEQARNKPSNF